MAGAKGTALHRTAAWSRQPEPDLDLRLCLPVPLDTPQTSEPHYQNEPPDLPLDLPHHLLHLR